MTPIKTWEELTICDNFLFQKVIQNKSLCKRLIEKLLSIKVEEITYLVCEKTVNVYFDRKGIRLDLYVKTDQGMVINIEMQTSDGELSELPKRARFYQASLDLDALDKGHEYNELNKSYIIFICTFDHFGLGRKVYTFTNRCHESEGLELGDETCKIFLNAKGTVGDTDQDIDKFLAYVNGKPAEGQFTQDVASEVEHIKQHNGMRSEYMSLMLALKQQRREGYDEGKTEGIAIGKTEGIAIGEAKGKAEGQHTERVFSIRNLMKTLGLTAEQAMDALLIPAEEQQKYLAQI
ncbi:Rpn family recombination-promoting nuclease/putative transposase [bacterium]|nr:Rpn family recombination-promoting nuclease/putative transposase [bacterium]